VTLAAPPGLVRPARGVYAGRAVVDGAAWPAAIDVGTNPTFGEEPLHVEAHLLGFRGDLQGRTVELEFWARLRDEVRFDSVDELRRKMAEDVERTRSLVR
jgi:riboflavin kinase/FMN adenylyltransferase